MKKCFSILFCFFLACAMAVTALAAEGEPDYIAEYEARYGKMPLSDDFPDVEDFQAAYDVWLAGLIPYCERRAAEYEQQKKAAEVETPTNAPEDIESVDANHEIDLSVSVFSGSVNQYPDRVRVDLAGNIYSLDGELLSPGTTPAQGPDEDGTLLPDELVYPDDFPAATDPDTLAVIAGPGSDVATDPPVWYVEDLRPADPPAEVSTGLKSLVTAIFGEYTPVTTTSVLSETVGTDTLQYLVETVASGTAGVDYEWIAGVVLFAIMLYCLMKLLGGVLK